MSCLALSHRACSDTAGGAADATTRPDAPVLFIDAGPKTYEQFEDFPREGCDDEGSLANFAYLGKWENVPGDGSTPFDSYFMMEGAIALGAWVSNSVGTSLPSLWCKTPDQSAEGA